MKTLPISAAILASAMFASSASYAACNEWGAVNYVYKSNTGVLAIIGGTACWVSVTGSNATAVAAVLSTANANDKEGYLTTTGEVAIEYQ
jgi:hypothetical protein